MAYKEPGDQKYHSIIPSSARVAINIIHGLRAKRRSAAGEKEKREHGPFCRSAQQSVVIYYSLARIFHELTSRDSGDALATGQSQELGPEVYLNSTSQGLSPRTPEGKIISAVAAGNS